MKTILVPTDFSPSVTNALQSAMIISKSTGAKIILMNNVRTLFTKWESLSEIEKHQHPEVLQQGSEALDRLNALTQHDSFKNNHIEKLITYGVTCDEIIRAAKKYNADIIVMASHGKTELGRDFIGSNIQKVIREAKCPVLTVSKEKANQEWRKILLPDSLNFDISVPFAKIKRIAQDLNSTIQLLYVNTPGNFLDTDTIHRRMTAFQQKYPELQFENVTYNNTDIEKGILQFIKNEKPDCVAMITYDHMKHPKYLLSLTESVVYHSDIPVLTIAVNSSEIEAHVKLDMASV